MTSLYTTTTAFLHSKKPEEYSEHNFGTLTINLLSKKRFLNFLEKLLINFHTNDKFKKNGFKQI